MDKLKKLIKIGEMYVKPEKKEEWGQFCSALYSGNELREVAIEIIEDAIKTMKFFDEGNNIEGVIKTIGRSWDGGMTYCLMILMIEKYSKKSELFVKELKSLQEKKETNRKLEGLAKYF